jgi:hypothetical protein
MKDQSLISIRHHPLPILKYRALFREVCYELPAPTNSLIIIYSKYLSHLDTVLMYFTYIRYLSLCLLFQSGNFQCLAVRASSTFQPHYAHTDCKIRPTSDLQKVFVRLFGQFNNSSKYDDSKMVDNSPCLTTRRHLRNYRKTFR